jgi:2'-5' RNA ligase
MTDRSSGEREERPRLFVAVELPPSWRDGFARLMDEMKDALAREARSKGVRVRWVRPEGIHLTLKFLGETPASRVHAVKRTLEQAVPEAPRLRLAAGRAGSFSDRRAPRVVWIGVEGETRELAALAERVDIALAAVGYPRERRGFAPHLTLARLPDGLSQAERDAVVAVTNAFTVPAFDPFVADQVSLMRSYLGPGGARYERMAAFPI